VSGIDAAKALIEFARRRVSAADLRVGPIEQLPWPDDSFDLVTGFNAFQFAADSVAALPIGRRSGGRCWRSHPSTASARR
jgi:ubiquinone/menaquinone biosynthesis C-methylase UbiE